MTRRLAALLLAPLLVTAPSAPVAPVPLAGFTTTTANPGNVVGTGTLAPPAGLRSLHADAANDGSVRLRWTPPAALGSVAPEAYDVQRAPAGSTAYTTIASPTPAAAGCGDGTCEHTDSTAAYNASYSYRVVSSLASWTAGPTNVTTAASLPPVRAVAKLAGTAYALYDVDDNPAATSATTAGLVAVGQGGRIVVCSSGCADASAPWTPAVSPTANDLYDVFVESTNRAWAVGAGGTVLTCADACTTAAAVWAPVSGLPGTPGTLRGVYSDGGYVVVVGASGYVARRKETSGAWAAAAVTNVGTGTVRGVTGTSQKQVVLVGDAGLVASCNASGQNACGDSGAPFVKRVTTATATFHGVTHVDRNTYAVVGAAGNVYVNTDNAVALFTKVLSAGTGTADLYDVAAQSGSVRAVGASGAVTTCASSCTTAASTWTASSAGTTASLHGIAGNAGWWVVGDNATIRRGSGTTWTAQTAPGATSAETPVEAALLARRDGTSYAVTAPPGTSAPSTCTAPSLLAYLSPPSATAAPTRVSVTLAYTATGTGGGTLLVSPDAGASWVTRSLPAATGAQEPAFDLSAAVPALSTAAEGLRICVAPSAGTTLAVDLVHADVDAA